jgi:hypothetical protein
VEQWDKGDGVYAVSPIEVGNWITLSQSITEQVPLVNGNLVRVLSMSATPVTFRLSIPPSTKLPRKWAFLISVVEYPRFQYTAGFDSLAYDISDTQASFRWSLIPVPVNTAVSGGHVNTSGYPSKVMVRSKEYSSPLNPRDMFTEPSDGTLIYYGSDKTSITDYNTTPYTYYSAWVQRVDGTWYAARGLSFLYNNACTVLVNSD